MCFLSRRLQCPEDRVASLLLKVAFGPSGALMIAALVMVSTFGCLNGIILAGSRVYYAMAKDSLFFASAAKLNKNEALPIRCCFRVMVMLHWCWRVLIMICWLCHVCGYAVYIFTIYGIFILRKKQPELERPHKVWGYPYLPIIYIPLPGLFALVLINNRLFAGVGLLIVLAGIPMYYLSKRFFRKGFPSSEILKPYPWQ